MEITYKEYKKTINIGIELLRFILCLWVVVFHCSNIKKNHEKYLKKGFHVPIFFILSFYFYYPNAYKRLIIKIKSRFRRLLYPYTFWSIFSFFLHNILLKFTSNIYSNKNLTIKDLFFQILFGTRYYRLFWFLFNLIFISLFITIISFMAKKNFLIVLEFIGIISLYIHFFGAYYKFFISYKSNICNSLGPLITFLPLAVTGCILSSINLILRLKNITFPLKIILFSLIYLFFEYNIYISYPGFMYPNVIANIQISTVFILAFGSLNLDKSKEVKGILNYITRYTGGIYYIHIIVLRYIMFNFKNNKTYFSSTLIYIISYMICFFGDKLVTKTDFKYLFI